MRKLLLLFLSISSISMVKSQVQSWKTGMMTGISGVHNFADGKDREYNYVEKEFNLLAVSTLTGKKISVSILYSFDTHSIGSISSLLLKNEWDAYAIGLKNLSESNGYTGIGLEKNFILTKDLKTFLFGEIGTDLTFKKQKITFGLILNYQTKIWSRK